MIPARLGVDPELPAQGHKSYRCANLKFGQNFQKKSEIEKIFVGRGGAAPRSDNALYSQMLYYFVLKLRIQK